MVSLLKPRFPLPNKIMMVLLLAIFVPAGVLYYFDYADLLTLGILAVIVAICEHYYATRHNIGMELRGLKLKERGLDESRANGESELRKELPVLRLHPPSP